MEPETNTSHTAQSHSVETGVSVGVQVSSTTTLSKQSCTKAVQISGKTRRRGPKSTVVAIGLTRQTFTILNRSDLDLVSSYRWHTFRDRDGRDYARSCCGVHSGCFLMHRLITGAAPGQVVDHINGDGLDNRRENLRVCTVAQNAANAGKSKRRGLSSCYKGVCRSVRGRFRASITFAGKKYNLGDHPTPEAAAEAYDAAALKFFGEFARPNFPAKARLA